MCLGLGLWSSVDDDEIKALQIINLKVEGRESDLMRVVKMFMVRAIMRYRPQVLACFERPRNFATTKTAQFAKVKNDRNVEWKAPL